MSIETKIEQTWEVASIHFNHLPWERISRNLLALSVESKGKLPASAISESLHFPISLVVRDSTYSFGSLDEGSDKPYRKSFFMWFSMNVDILSYEGFLASSYFRWVALASRLLFWNIRPSGIWIGTSWYISWHDIFLISSLARYHLICKFWTRDGEACRLYLIHHHSGIWGPKLGMMISQYSFGWRSWVLHLYSFTEVIPKDTMELSWFLF